MFVFLYFVFALACLLIVASGPSKLSWGGVLIRLAGVLAFPLAPIWLILPAIVNLKVYGFGFKEAQYERLANLILAGSSFCLFVVTVGIGLMLHCQNNMTGIRPIRLDDSSSIIVSIACFDCDVSISQHVRSPNILNVAFHGKYRYGSDGNADADYMRAMAEAGLDYTQHRQLH
jgi:hypothetical protein